MADITPGVKPANYRVTSAEQAAAHAIDLAWSAANLGTFGVGGFLMGQDGRVFAEAVNAVMRDGHVCDPTAHVERQLVDWFRQSRARGVDLSPDNLTIVSSLDPCAMCAGAILQSGLKAIAIADDRLSGVHAGGSRPHCVPQSLRSRADRSIGMFATSSLARTHRIDVGFTLQPLPDEMRREAEEAFSTSLDKVKISISAVSDGAGLGPASDVLKVLSQDRDLGRTLGSHISFPSRDLPSIGDEKIRGSVLVAGDGTALLRARPSGTHAGSSIVELVRAYAFVRLRAWEKYKIALPHQRSCMTIALDRETDTAAALMSLGAVGSAMEDRSMSTDLPVVGVLDERTADFYRQIVETMPPLYKDILGISIGLIPTRVLRSRESVVAF